MEAVTPCFKWHPDDELLKNSQSAAKAYNDKHKN